MSNKEKQTFLCFKRPGRKNFASTMTEEEAETMSIHFGYMQKLLAEGVLIVAGPVISGEFGLSIVEAESEEAARELVNNDPAVAGGIMTPEVYPFRLSLMRK